MENCDNHHHLLPQDALIQILLCLPVISLLRFKSVCKSWRDLIESSFFIHLHAATLRQENSSSSKLGTFIFQSFRERLLPFDMVKNNFFMLSSNGHDDEFEVFEDLGVPPYYMDYSKCHHILMVGSCNGVICLHDAKLRDVSLWNPAIKQFRLLPKSLTFAGIGVFDEDFVAFGFDVKTKDYKVVQVTYFRPVGYKNEDRWRPPDGYAHRVQVYSLSTDSWRCIDVALPARPTQGGGINHGRYLNGSYFGLGQNWFHVQNWWRDVSVILSFDFAEESFRTMQLPDEVVSYCHYLNFTSLGEKIAFFDGVVDDEAYYTYDMWVLNELGVKESWTKLYTIGPYRAETPVGISNNGEFTFLAGNNSSDEKLQLFNLVTQVVKQLQSDGENVIRADVYKPSLVSIIENGATSDRVICAV